MPGLHVIMGKLHTPRSKKKNPNRITTDHCCRFLAFSFLTSRASPVCTAKLVLFSVFLGGMLTGGQRVGVGLDEGH